jgi:stage IV sporulation protein FB
MNFRFLNIPVHIQPSFWFFLLFFTGLYRGFSVEGLMLGGILFFTLLVHEYGHAWTAMYFGASARIVLEAFGGKAQYSGFRMSPKQEFLIVLNGPLLQSLLIALPYSFLRLGIFENYYMLYFLHATMRLNILWCLLNLIPLLPLDGGYLARYFLEKRFGDKGCRISIILGLVCMASVQPYLYREGYLCFAILLLIYGVQNFQMLMDVRTSRASSNGSNSFTSYMQGVEAIKSQDFENAKAILSKLVKSKDAHIKNLSMEALAKTYFLQNEGQKAYDLLLKADHQSLKEGKCLLCKLAFERENYDLVDTYSMDIYEIEPSYEIALLNSQAFARLNKPAHAGAWLETASQFETACKESLKDLMQHPVYDPVRDQSGFKQYAERI